MSSLKSVVRNDELYIKFRNIYRMAVKTSNFNELIEEVENLHKGRSSRTLYLKTPNLDKLIDAALQDSAYRSRCIEIIVTTSKTQRLLQASIDAVYNHIIAKYSSYLVDYKNQSAKDSAIASILQPAYSKISEIEGIIEIAQHVVSDIDKMAWSLKSVQESMALILQRENIVKTSI